jgi:hypothetical protein
LIIAALFKVGPDDIIAVGVIPFVAASLFSITRLLILGLRYHYYVGNFVGPVGKMRENIEVRTGSEFISLTTPAYIGGEFMRLAWLHKRGVHAGKGMWIVSMEVISDILVGSFFAYIAALIAFMAENYFIAATILAIITPIFVTYMTLLFISSRKTLQVPSIVSRLLSRIAGADRAEGWTLSANETLRVLCETCKENLRSSSVKAFVVGLGLTFAATVLYALSFLVLANGSGSIGLFESLLAVSASLAVGTLPVSPGGSGLSEFGIGAYLPTFGLDMLAFGSIIIVWRIASYHVPLVATWAVLMNLASRKVVQPKARDRSYYKRF